MREQTQLNFKHIDKNTRVQIKIWQAQCWVFFHIEIIIILFIWITYYSNSNVANRQLSLPCVVHRNLADGKRCTLLEYTKENRIIIEYIKGTYMFCIADDWI